MWLLIKPSLKVLFLFPTYLVFHPEENPSAFYCLFQCFLKCRFCKKSEATLVIARN